MAKEKTVSIMGTGAMFKGSETQPKEADDSQKLKKATKLNNAAKIILAVMFAFFSVLFWTVAILEYVRPAELYL